jgi:heme A synthase
VYRDWLGRLTLAVGFGLAALLVLLGLLLARRSRSVYPIMTLAVLLVGLGVSLGVWATTKGYPCRGMGDVPPCRHIVLPLLTGAGSVATAFVVALLGISQRRRRFRESGPVAAR